MRGNFGASEWIDLILVTHAHGDHLGDDTGLFGDMRWIGEYYKPDLILIPIGGHFLMSPQDAAIARATW